MIAIGDEEVQKPSIFISHIFPEKKLALSLKKVIEKAFLGMADTFVSSDPECLPAGKKWYETITSRLKDASIVFVFISPQSILKPWISFEAGAASIREIPMIPLCHSGISVRNLPAPFSFHQAVNADDIDSMKLITSTIASAIGSNKPEIEFEAIVEEVKKFEVESQQLENHDHTLFQIDSERTETLKPHEWQCLQLLSGMEVLDTDNETSYYEIKAKMNDFNFTNTAANLSIRSLERLGLIEFVDANSFNGFEMESYKGIRITNSGWKYINRIIPDSFLVNNDFPF